MLAARPEHVPEDLVFNVDIYDPSGSGQNDNPYAVWKHIQDTHPPIFWTPRQGGHWIITRYDDLRHIAETYSHFSNRENFIPRGVTVPQIPMNLDPPEHNDVKKLLVRELTPKRLQEISEKVRGWSIELVEELAPRKECEFVSQFASIVPVKAFLSLMGLPEEDNRILNEVGADITKINEPETYQTAKQRLSEYMRDRIRWKKAQPVGPGIVSAAIHNDIGSRRLDDEEVENLCVMLLAAGIDTVKSAIVFMFDLLATSPRHRQQLLDDSKLIPQAVEETLRRYGSTNIARVVRQDTVYKGIQFRTDDMVCLAYPLGGLDDLQTTAPMDIDFGRQAIRHMNFGSGQHACIGQALARQELAIVTREWLSRIPNFERKPGSRMKLMTGLTNIALELDLVW